LNMSPSPDRPLNDVERERMNAILSRFHSENAIHNAEEVDGFFASLICSPEIAKPNEYLAKIWGEMKGHGMNTSPKFLWFDDNSMWVELADGRILGIPIAWFPRLLHATPEHRQKFEANG
jgi:hypothetical protein